VSYEYRSEAVNHMISVIIPTFNREHTIAQAIESVLAQTYKDLEIIVIDDGSTDDTKTVLEPYKDRIKYFYQENKGVASARNKGLEEARGEFIAFLDSDDYWLPEKLRSQTEFLKAHPDTAMVYDRYWREYEETGNKKLRPKKEYLTNGYIYTRFYFKYIIWIGTVMVRRICFETVGDFDTSLVVASDRDMLLRITREYRVGFMEEPLAVHKIHKTSLGRHNKQKTLESKERALSLGFQRLKTWEKFLYFIPFRFKYSRHLAKIGKHYLIKKEYKTGKTLYGRAIIKYPFRLKYWIGFFKCIIKNN